MPNEMKVYSIKDYGKPYQNLYDTLEDSARKYPDKAAIIDDEETVTYRELLARADRLAQVFRYEYQMKEQEQIGFLMVNSAKTVAAFYAAMKIGCIAVMINTKFRKQEIADLLETMEVKLIVSDARWLDKIEETAAGMGLRGILTEFPDAGPNVDGEQIPAIKNLENTAVIMHTSGTTGPPKGVMITHKNILEAAYGYQEVQGLDKSAKTVLSVPMFHILGLSCVTTYFIYMGATIVLSEFYHADDVLRKIQKYRATHFHSVPAIFQQLVENGYPEQVLPSLRVVVCGGAPVGEELLERFCRMAPNATLHLAYGMTETAGSGTLSAVHKEPLKAVPNVQMKVVDQEHNELKPGEIGELVFCGPCIAKGRWKMEGLPKSEMYSGDVGYMDEDGGIYVIDRLKDIINRGGEKIFPVQIETVLLQYPGVEKAVVYAVSDEKYGEVPAAAIIPKKGVKVVPEELKAYMKKRVATFECPVYIELTTDFPVTQNGKIRKAELRRRTEERRNGT